MINLLVRLHFCNSFWENSSICPEYIPVVCVARGRANVIISIVHLVRVLIFVGALEVKKTLGNKLDHEIFGVAQIYHQAFLVFELRVVFIILNSYSFSKSLLLRIISFLLFFLWLRLGGSLSRSLSLLLRSYSLWFRITALRALTPCFFDFNWLIFRIF